MKIYGGSITVMINREFGQLSSSWAKVQRRHILGTLHLSDWKDIAFGDCIQCGTACSRYEGRVEEVESFDQFIRVTIIPIFHQPLLAEGASLAFADRDGDVSFVSGKNLNCVGEFGSAETPTEYHMMKNKARMDWQTRCKTKIVNDPEQGIIKLTGLISPDVYEYTDGTSKGEIQGVTSEVFMRQYTSDDIARLCSLFGLFEVFVQATHIDLRFSSYVPQSEWVVGQRLLKLEDKEWFVWDTDAEDFMYASDDHDFSNVVVKPNETEQYKLND